MKNITIDESFNLDKEEKLTSIKNIHQPSKKCVQHILNYSKSRRVIKTNSVGAVSLMLN